MTGQSSIAAFHWRRLNPSLRQRLRGIEPRLKPGGKYEMATLELVEQTSLDRSTVEALVREAVALNKAFGDPT